MKPQENIARIARGPPLCSRNACKSPHFQAADKRTVLRGAVGMHPTAVDNSLQFRPQESPAKRSIMSGAVDAGGILAVVATKDRPPGSPPSLPVSAVALQSCLECRSSHYAGPRRPKGLTGETTAQVGLYVHWGQDKSKAC